MSHRTYLTTDQLCRALELRDLTDPRQGPHALHLLLDGIVSSLSSRWNLAARTVRSSPLVTVNENYDRLGFATDAISRDERYTRYVSSTIMLRSHTSAAIPTVLESYRGAAHTDEFLVIPGLVYRRDAVDRHHVGEPHQVDLWRVKHGKPCTDDDLLEMVDTVVEAVLPGAPWRVTEAVHPYTLGGLQVDVRHENDWLELAECGRIHPDVLTGSGLDPEQWSGLALGMGLERAVMIRKGIPDIRFLRAVEPRIAEQMQTLDAWRPVSLLPAARRDLSIVASEHEDDETLGDRVRASLGSDVEVLESITVLKKTSHADLPDSARDKLKTRPGQANLLVRLVIRPLERTLTSGEANDLRNRVYLAIHEGPVMELIDGPDALPSPPPRL